MAIKISQLPVATASTGAELVPIVQGGVTKKGLLSTLFAWAGGSSLVGFIDSGTGAVATTVQADLRSGVVKASRYGASPSASAAANATAIQNALNTLKSVQLDPGNFSYDTGLIFKAVGQKLMGCGWGDNGGSGMTILTYTGANGASMISWYNAAALPNPTNYSECGVLDMLLNGNGKAHVGLEMYNIALAGGCWRGLADHVAIYGVTYEVAVAAGNFVAGNLYTIVSVGTTDFTLIGAPTNTVGVSFVATGIGVGTGTAKKPSCNIFTGNGTGNDNANDYTLSDVYTVGGSCGVITGGAQGTMSNHCAIQGATVAGVLATVGADIDIGNSLLINNAVDIDDYNAGHVRGAGGRCEQSTVCVYRGATGHHFGLTGFSLHTLGADLMNFGACAGVHYIIDAVLLTGSTSANIANVNQGATGIISGSGITASYVTNNRRVPEIIPQRNYGTGGTWSVSASLTLNQTVVLPLSRGAWFVGVHVWKANAPALTTRTSAAYIAHLSDGDSEVISAALSSDNGSNGPETFTIAASNNSVTVTYTGADTAEVFVSGSGVCG